MWHLWELFGHSLGPLEGAWRPEEDKKYMRIKREAAGQEEKEREQRKREKREEGREKSEGRRKGREQKNSKRGRKGISDF